MADMSSVDCGRRLLGMLKCLLLLFLVWLLCFGTVDRQDVWCLANTIVEDDGPFTHAVKARSSAVRERQMAHAPVHPEGKHPASPSATAVAVPSAPSPAAPSVPVAPGSSAAAASVPETAWAPSQQLSKLTIFPSKDDMRAIASIDLPRHRTITIFNPIKYNDYDDIERRKKRNGVEPKNYKVRTDKRSNQFNVQEKQSKRFSPDNEQKYNSQTDVRTLELELQRRRGGMLWEIINRSRQKEDHQIKKLDKLHWNITNSISVTEGDQKKKQYDYDQGKHLSFDRTKYPRKRHIYLRKQVLADYDPPDELVIRPNYVEFVPVPYRMHPYSMQKSHKKKKRKEQTLVVQLAASQEMLDGIEYLLHGSRQRVKDNYDYSDTVHMIEHATKETTLPPLPPPPPPKPPDTPLPPPPPTLPPPSSTPQMAMGSFGSSNHLASLALVLLCVIAPTAVL